MDTGDTIRHKTTGERHIVACVHPPIVYVIGYPPTPLRLDDVTLDVSATDEQRRAQLAAMAESSGQGHRPRCARERLRGEGDE